MTAMVGMPMPSPTAKAMISLVVRPELKLVLGLVLVLVLGPPLLFFGVLVSVGVEPAADVELPLPMLPGDPVAIPASADTTAVVVLLGDGLFAAGSQENMNERAL